jgi:hypothetical protein
VTKRIVFPREVLLVEVERRCGETLCGARVRLSLTKGEARAYTGFECERCGRWFADALTERDIPEWWEELNVASLVGLKPAPESSKPARQSASKRTSAARDSMSVKRNSPPAPREALKPALEPSRAVEEDDEENDAEVVARMSKAWRHLGMERESEPEVAKPEGSEGKRGDSF